MRSMLFWAAFDCWFASMFFFTFPFSLALVMKSANVRRLLLFHSKNSSIYIPLGQKCGCISFVYNSFVHVIRNETNIRISIVWSCFTSMRTVKSFSSTSEMWLLMYDSISIGVMDVSNRDAYIGFSYLAFFDGDDTFFSLVVTTAFPKSWFLNLLVPVTYLRFFSADFDSSTWFCVDDDVFAGGVMTFSTRRRFTADLIFDKGGLGVLWFKLGVDNCCGLDFISSMFFSTLPVSSWISRKTDANDFWSLLIVGEFLLSKYHDWIREWCTSSNACQRTRTLAYWQ